MHKPAHFCLKCYHLGSVGVNLQTRAMQILTPGKDSFFMLPLRLRLQVIKPSQRPKVNTAFYFLIAPTLQLTCPIWFTGQTLCWHQVAKCEEFEEGESSGLDVLWHMIPSAIYSLIYSLSQQRPQCFYLWGDSESSISTQWKPLVVYSLTLR